MHGLHVKDMVFHIYMAALALCIIAATNSYRTNQIENKVSFFFHEKSLFITYYLLHPLYTGCAILRVSYSGTNKY
jgi:hypothetical protein